MIFWLFNGPPDQPHGPEKAQLSQGRVDCIRWMDGARRRIDSG